MVLKNRANDQVNAKTWETGSGAQLAKEQASQLKSTQLSSIDSVFVEESDLSPIKSLLSLLLSPVQK
jgi:hypothetical protein